MPNTKSAEHRMRSNARRQSHNQTIKSRLKTLEKAFLGLAATGKKDEAAATLRAVSAAFDKAAKTGVLHPNNASRKKSRLASRLAQLK
jgi:small subunit ribosomal protein S20